MYRKHVIVFDLGGLQLLFTKEPSFWDLPFFGGSASWVKILTVDEIAKFL